MNFKKVFLLVKAEIKSYRLVSSERFRKFRENKFFIHFLYISACILGFLAGWMIGNFYSKIPDPSVKDMFLQGVVLFLISLPMVVVLTSLILTQINQFQRLGAKLSTQPLYWFPISWEEHTLASIIASILGVPLAFTLFLSLSILVASIFLNIVPLAVLTVFSLFLSDFVASVTTEILKNIQKRIYGALTKVGGRKTIWLRFIGSILFLTIFYFFYFSMYYQVKPTILLKTVVSGLKNLWFIPYTWPSILLSLFINGYIYETIILLIMSMFFAYLLFLAATKLNIKYGLYETPAITISRGIYVSKPGLLRKLGLSAPEVALVKKDFKGLIRRQELASILIFPIISTVVVFVVIVMRIGGESSTRLLYLFVFTYLTLVPGVLMAMGTGIRAIGLEGTRISYIFSMPIDAKTLVRAKYTFTVLLSLTTALICSLIGVLVCKPSLKTLLLSVSETVFLIFSLGMISISFSIKGPDFRELPRPRMIQPIWGIISFLTCFFIGLIETLPVIPFLLIRFLELSEFNFPFWTFSSVPEIYFYIGLSISGVIAFAVTHSFYRFALENAKKFLVHAEKVLAYIEK